jgi:pyruvate dehydrogenase E1 component beta subunit
VRPGNDVTLVTWSTLLPAAVEAAAAAERDGLSVEVIDLRSLWPWDRDAVLTSAARTKRVLVAHEAVAVGGFGGEVAATIAEELGVRVARIGAPRMPVAYAPVMENAYRVDSERIGGALKKLVARG